MAEAATLPDKKKPPVPAPKPGEPDAIAEFTAGYLDKPKEAPTKPAAEKPKPAAEKPKPKPKVEKPAPVVAEPPLSAEKIAEIADEVVSRRSQKPEGEKKPEPESKFEPAQERTISVLKEMEKNPKYKDSKLAEKYEKSLTNLLDYATKWEAEHPGETFDEDAEEHKAFIEKNSEGVEWDDDDYTDALADIKSEKILDQSKKHTDERLSKFEQAEKLREEAPKIEAVKIKNAREFLKGMGKEYENLVAEDGKLNVEAWNKLAAEDPVKIQLVRDSADTTEALVAENYKLFNGLAPYDARNPVHQTLNNFILSREAEMLAQPPEKQRDGQGRQFLANDKFWALAPEKRKNHWTFNQNDVEVMLVKSVLKKTREHIKSEDEKFDARVKARGLAPVNGQPPVAKPIVEPEVETAEDEKPNTPEVNGAPRTPGAGGAPAEVDPQAKFANRFLGKTA